MIPNIDEILAQLVTLWHLEDETEPVEPITMGKLASDLMYPPIFIINALDLGKDMGILEHDFKTDEVKVIGQLTTTHMGQEVQRLANAIEDKVRFENQRESDLNLGLLQSWCMGVRPSAIRLAIWQLTDQNVIHEYRVADPLDQDSVYEFYTLVDNKDRKWGLKQFKKTKKDKRAKDEKSN